MLPDHSPTYSGQQEFGFIGWNACHLNMQKLKEFMTHHSMDVAWEAIGLQECYGIRLRKPKKIRVGQHLLVAGVGASYCKFAPAVLLHHRMSGNIVRFSSVPGVIFVLLRLDNGNHLLVGSIHAPHSWGKDSLDKYVEFWDSAFLCLRQMLGTVVVSAMYISIDANARIAADINFSVGPLAHQFADINIERQHILLNFLEEFDIRLWNTCLDLGDGSICIHQPFAHGQAAQQIDFIGISADVLLAGGRAKLCYLCML